jgi:hypothetical protein
MGNSLFCWTKLGCFFPNLSPEDRNRSNLQNVLFLFLTLKNIRISETEQIKVNSNANIIEITWTVETLTRKGKVA